jgi:maltose alpha-D-glucosyltransferase/alpha-amylase
VIARDAAIPGARGALVGARTRAFPPALDADLPGCRLGAEQSNTSIALGDRLVLKHVRRLGDGRNPDEEIGRFLTERTAFPHAPRLVGHAEYRPGDGEPMTVAVVHELVAGARDGWEWMLAELAAVYRDGFRDGRPPDAAAVAAAGSVTLGAIRRLGAVTAALHRALASDPDAPAFAPEPITVDDCARWARAVERQLDDARAVLGARLRLDAPELTTALGTLVGLRKIRHHGDFHLGQTLYRAADGAWMIIDFEGEPLRPLAERRRKASALRDVAGLLRSLDYAATTAMPSGLDRWADAWATAAAAEFVAGYRAGIVSDRLVPTPDDAFARALSVFVLEKAAYEVVYEASHRPAWLGIPIRGLERALATLR